MARIQRRRRARCRLPCEIAPARGARVGARVVTLSEGGLAVVTGLALTQGDPIRLRISSRGGARPIPVSAIVWNVRPAGGEGDAALWRLGCVVSDPPPAFLALVDRFAPPSPKPVPVAMPRPASPGPPRAGEPDLPRRRDLEPPPKPEPEERLPRFRVRLKQLGGPRTRLVTVPARSATDARQRALRELERAAGGGASWDVLEIVRLPSRS